MRFIFLFLLLAGCSRETGANRMAEIIMDRLIILVMLIWIVVSVFRWRPRP